MVVADRFHCDLVSLVTADRWSGAILLTLKLTPKQNCHHIADYIFICIFLNENVWISLKTLLKFVPKVLINNIPTLVPIMVWCQPGDKPLSGPIMVYLTDAYMRHSASSKIGYPYAWWCHGTKTPCVALAWTFCTNSRVAGHLKRHSRIWIKE